MAVETLAQERKVVREKFEIACLAFLAKQYQLSEDDSRAIVASLDHGLEAAYQKRGIEIARSVFTDDVVNFSDSTDLLDTVNCAVSSMADQSLHPVAADLMIEVLLRPNKVMRDYLAALSQGYFAFHALGLDPDCSDERLKLAKQHPWIADSSILLPLLALSCQNHQYAQDLFARMRELGFTIYTTERLCMEVQDHAYWALANFSDKSVSGPEILQAAASGPGYKQNLFLDGFVSWARSEGNPVFLDYMEQCLGTNFQTELYDSVKAKLAEYDRIVLQSAVYAVASTWKQIWRKFKK